MSTSRVLANQHIQTDNTQKEHILAIHFEPWWDDINLCSSLTYTVSTVIVHDWLLLIHNDVERSNHTRIMCVHTQTVSWIRTLSVFLSTLTGLELCDPAHRLMVAMVSGLFAIFAELLLPGIAVLCRDWPVLQAVTTLPLLLLLSYWWYVCVYLEKHYGWFIIV